MALVTIYYIFYNIWSRGPWTSYECLTEVLTYSLFTARKQSFEVYSYSEIW